MTEKRRRHVLVVDTEITARRQLVAELIQHGFACDTATDGDEAEDRLASKHYDAVVTDVNIPNKHGHEFVMNVLAMKLRPIVIVYTEVEEPKVKQVLLDCGVDEVAYKPYGLGILAAQVKVLVLKRFASNGQIKAEVSDAMRVN